MRENGSSDEGPAEDSRSAGDKGPAEDSRPGSDEGPPGESPREGDGGAAGDTPRGGDEDEEGGSEPDAGRQPGLEGLHAAVASYARRRFHGPAEPRKDGIAGLSIAIANVPDGLANGALVGVNPVFGLYATMIGPAVGGVLSSTRLLVISTTAAASLTTGQALVGFEGEARTAALVLLVVLVGILQIAAGLLKLGRLTRFVSYSVTTGFLTGVAVLLVLSQLPTIAGVEVAGGNRVAQTVDLLTRARDMHPGSLAMGGSALVLAVVLPRTPLGAAGRLIAVALPSVLMLWLGLDGVATVADIGSIPREVPTPVMPSFIQVFDVLTGALSVAVVILVQGSGVSESVPNPDGSRSDASRDFIAQGAANVVSGLFRGLPVGGSASTTALAVVSDARSRWAPIFAGIWMAVIVIGVPGLVGYVTMPALGALLVLVGVSSVRRGEIESVWHSGTAARLAGGTTFLATLFVPIQAAVGIGVALSALLFLQQSSTDVRIVQVVKRADGRLEEREPPETLRDRGVTVLDVYGDLFYAGARTLEETLPRVRGARRPVVVLRLRGRTAAGATLVDVLARYAEELERAGGRLYLTGLHGSAYRRLVDAVKLHRAGAVHVRAATAIIGEATRDAVADAEAWLRELRDEASDDDGGS